MNRRERRKQAKLFRAGDRVLKLRCICCDRVGQHMTDEHFFPRWLIAHADVRRDGISWRGKKGVNPERATIPLCEDCNSALGQKLEAPVALIFRAIEAGENLSDDDCGLLVRWMWKFEGLAWGMSLGKLPNARYSDKFTMLQQLTDPRVFEEIRPRMALALATIEQNDEGFEDWPIGLDTPVSETNAICVSGVFGRVALITLLVDFAQHVPPEFGVYRFDQCEVARHLKAFLPPQGFPNPKAAIKSTTTASEELVQLHEQLGREERAQQQVFLPPRQRLELPPV